MNHFKLLGKLDITKALEEVLANQGKFKPHTKIPEQSYPLREGQSIHLRIHDQSKRLEELSELKGAEELANKVLKSRDTKRFEKFPECRKLIYRAMSLTGKKGRLGRVYIAKMIPGGSIYPHKDPGKYFELHDRYHIVLQTNDGVSFSCGDDDATTETVRFDTGELWVFSNKVTHWAQNNGDTDRIHIIIDIQHDDPYYKAD